MTGAGSVLNPHLPPPWPSPEAGLVKLMVTKSVSSGTPEKSSEKIKILVLTGATKHVAYKSPRECVEPENKARGG